MVFTFTLVFLTYYFICLVHKLLHYKNYTISYYLVETHTLRTIWQLTVVVVCLCIWWVGGGDSAVVRAAAGAGVALSTAVRHSMAGGHSAASVAHAVGYHRGVAGRISRPLGSSQPIRPLTLSFLPWVAVIQHYREPGVEGCIGVSSCQHKNVHYSTNFTNVHKKIKTFWNLFKIYKHFDEFCFPDSPQKVTLR